MFYGRNKALDRSGSDSRAELWLAVGALVWLIAVIARWPIAVSFGDEVGYLGEVRMLLDGRLRPLPASVGIMLPTDKGVVSLFPLLVPLLVTPLFAIAPRLVFLSGVAAALALAFLTSRVLRAWGRSPLWGLIVLADPAVVIIARTVMADLLLAMFAVGAWWSLRRGRLAWASVLLALVVATKVTGLAIAGALLAGEAIGARQDLLRRDRRALLRLAWGAGGILVGGVVMAALNLMSIGRIWFTAYSAGHTYLKTPSFWPVYFWRTAPVHAASLLLLPPALIAGAWPLWRRRELGPLLVTLGLPAMMCFYFFVDHGRSVVETLVLSQRLILPAVAFLLLGYADQAAGLVGLFPRAAKGLIAFGVIGPGVLAFAISARHRSWQEPGAAALAAATHLLAERNAGGPGTLGLTFTAVKAGVLYRGPVSLVFEAPTTEVVLCSTESASYREPGARYTCDIPGYEDRFDSGTFHVLARRRP